jgi:hypothetical protein
VTIPNPTFSGNSCSFARRLNEESRDLASVGLESTFTCSCTTTTITVNDGFASSSFAAGGTILFDIDGVKNPVSQAPSDSFEVTTKTSGLFDIDELTSGILVVMTSVSPLQTVSILSTSLRNGASNNITFSINSPSDLVNGDIVTIVFPTQITLPSTPV